MTKVAFLFPGQGSQVVGMGRHLWETHEYVRPEFFDLADRVLELPLTQMCFEGPEDVLVRTENQQPAIFLVSATTCAVLEREGLHAEAVAGHSLGEYSALVAAGSLEFSDALRLTRRRGELMAEVGRETGGTMAAILGLSPQAIEEVCAAAGSKGIVEVANYNSPTQTVVSGDSAAVTEAMEIARARGAKRVVPLPVSAPFHCRLMEPLATAFQPILDATRVKTPRIGVVANVTADYEWSPEEIRINLLRQLASAVRWTGTVERLAADGFDTFVEVGPGRVLKGLVRSINSSLRIYSTENIEALENVLDELVKA